MVSLQSENIEMNASVKMVATHSGKLYIQEDLQLFCLQIKCKAR